MILDSVRYRLGELLEQYAGGFDAISIDIITSIKMMLGRGLP
jgi:hypothetical protein